MPSLLREGHGVLPTRSITMTQTNTARTRQPTRTREERPSIQEQTSQAFDTLCKALEEGRSESLSQFLTAMARFHRYSFRNCLLIVSQCPHATHVAGFQTWKSVNRFVKAGEKGIVIAAPMRCKHRDDADTPVQSLLAKSEAGAGKESDNAREASIRFRGVYVFDISQTDGEPLPSLATAHGDVSTDLLNRVRGFAASHSITIDADLADVPETVLGVSRGGRISIRADLTPAEYVTTLVHELAHERLHRPDTATPSATPLVSSKTKELEAEAVSMVVCTALGIDALGASADYIQLYAGNADALRASLQRIQSAAQEMLAFMLADEVTSDAVETAVISTAAPE